MFYYSTNLPERNFSVEVSIKKLCKDTKKINTLKRSALSQDQLRNLLERNLISFKEYLLVICSEK
jgi:hypothetical protein